MSLTIVCLDESECVINNPLTERLGVVLDGLFETGPNPVVKLGHLFRNKDSVDPLKRFLEGNYDDGILNFTIVQEDGCDLAACYEAALGELNIPAFVDMVDSEVYRMVADHEKYNSPALFALPTIAAIRKAVLKAFPEKPRPYYWTRDRMYASIGDYNDMLIMLTDIDSFVAVLNFERCMKRPKFYEWLTSDQEEDNLRTDNHAIRQDMLKFNPEKKNYMVFEGNAHAYIDMLYNTSFEGLWILEGTFDILLRRQDKSGTSYKPMYTKTICTNNLDDYIHRVNAVAGYIKPTKGATSLFYKDCLWKMLAFPDDKTATIVYPTEDSSADEWETEDGDDDL